jgi:hypothetical protein
MKTQNCSKITKQNLIHFVLSLPQSNIARPSWYSAASLQGAVRGAELGEQRWVHMLPRSKAKTYLKFSVTFALGLADSVLEQMSFARDIVMRVNFGSRMKAGLSPGRL